MKPTLQHSLSQLRETTSPSSLNAYCIQCSSWRKDFSMSESSEVQIRVMFLDRSKSESRFPLAKEHHQSQMMTAGHSLPLTDHSLLDRSSQFSLVPDDSLDKCPSDSQLAAHDQGCQTLKEYFNGRGTRIKAVFPPWLNPSPIPNGRDCLHTRKSWAKNVRY